MMDSLDSQVADIERELLALTANQPPNPNQMPLYTVTGTTSADPEIYIVVFEDGIIRVLNAYVSTGSVIISYYLGNLEIYLYSASPIDFQAVSLGKFSLIKKV